MIYLIGIKHLTQGFEKKDNTIRKIFSEYLDNKITEIKPSILAEEWTDYADQTIKNNNLTKNIASKNNLGTVWIEPNEEEREMMGIPTTDEIESCAKKEAIKQISSLNKEHFESFYRSYPEFKSEHKKGERRYFPKRHSFWFCRLSDYLNKDIIIICGDQHLDDCKNDQSFLYYLKSRGHNCQVLTRWDKLCNI